MGEDGASIRYYAVDEELPEACAMFARSVYDKLHPPLPSIAASIIAAAAMVEVMRQEGV